MDTHNDNIELLKHHINLVVKDINDIIASNISSAEKSNLINTRMRDVKVYLEKTYIDQFLNGDIEKVTIDPSRCKLTESDCNNEPLYANSFGPFYPEDYFEKDFKVLWILKEPYITVDSWNSVENPDRGRHDKAAEYKDYNVVKQEGKYNTYNTVVTTVKEIINRKFKIEIDEQEAMRHLCIIELNHFSGLNFNSYESDDKLLKHWAIINHNLYSTLINFYNPNLIVLNSGLMGSLIEFRNQNGEMTSSYIDHEIFNSLRKGTPIKQYNEEYCKECTITIVGRELTKTSEGHSEKCFPRDCQDERNIASAVYDVNSCVWVGFKYHPMKGRCEKGEDYEHKWDGFASAVVNFLNK